MVREGSPESSNLATPIFKLDGTLVDTPIIAISIPGEEVQGTRCSEPGPGYPGRIPLRPGRQRHHQVQQGPEQPEDPGRRIPAVHANPVKLSQNLISTGFHTSGRDPFANSGVLQGRIAEVTAAAFQLALNQGESILDALPPTAQPTIRSLA